ncbi:MAG: D-aminoacyl-tRNA deacylase [Deltaproteobacteria bacterium]
MRAVVQRVSGAAVAVGGQEVGRIGTGLLVLAGFAPSDDGATLRWMAEKIARLRIFEDDAGKMNRSVAETGGGILLVPQFTLYADAAKGNRPSFTGAAPPERAKALFQEWIGMVREISGVPVAAGVFGASMRVELVNDGPVTILLEK